MLCAILKAIIRAKLMISERRKTTILKYVLSIKRVKDIFGKEMIVPKWEYASYDNFSGPMSSGYPIFADLSHAISFPTPEAAEEWFKNNSQYINLSSYGIPTLAVRKLIFKTIKKVSYD